MKSPNANRDAAETLFEARKNAADKVSARIANDRQQKMQADAVKTARLREQRLAKEAADASATAGKAPKADVEQRHVDD